MKLREGAQKLAKSCRYCCYNDICKGFTPCRFYDPDEEGIDAEVDDKIEKEKKEYYYAWLEYIDESGEEERKARTWGDVV